MADKELLLQAENIWQEIIRKATGFEKDTENKLNLSKGASESDLLEVETVLKVRLPEEMEAFYAIHNGQTRVSGVTPFARNLILLATKAVVAQWQFLNDEFEGNDLELQADKNIQPML